MAIPAVSFFCRHSLAYFLPSVILGPCPGIQVFIANNSLDSRLLARMTTGRAVTAKWGGFPACRDGRERRAWILR